MRNVLLQWLFTSGRPVHKISRGFKVHNVIMDHVRVQSSSCCFPRELVSFIRPRELERFNPRHVTRSAPIRKRIWVGRCNNVVYRVEVVIAEWNESSLKFRVCKVVKY